MAYEVTKIVNGRPYRYRVRSERDPGSGKMRNRWTYLGRVTPGGDPVAVKRRPNAREALLDAMERMLERADPEAVTAAAVAIEAGVAHGTFYRYFPNKAAAVHALAERLRSARAGDLALLDDAPAGLAQARRALRAWTEAVLRTKTDRPGLVRVWYALAARDAAFQAAGRERRDASRRRLEGWLADLTARAIVGLPDPESTAGVLFVMLDGIGRDAVAAGEPLDDARIAAAVDLVERSVFGRLG
jgi:AcrR family transcriptional regulator